LSDEVLMSGFYLSGTDLHRFFWKAGRSVGAVVVVVVVEAMETMHVTQQRRTLVSSPNPNVLANLNVVVAVSMGMRVVKFCSSKISSS